MPRVPLRLQLSVRRAKVALGSLGDLARTSFVLLRTHYMSAVSLMVLGLALVLALNSSSVVHDGRSDTHRQQSSTDRPPIRTNSAALNQPAEDPTITYVLYSDQSQIASLYLAVVDAHSEVRTVALNTGIKHAPDPGEVVFFHVTHPEDEAEAMMLIKDLMADAAVRGSELNVLDLRSSH